MKKSLINIAKGVAYTSNGVGKRNSFRIGAVLFNKKKVITGKPNVNRTHPALAAFTEFPYLHAETNCVLSHGLAHCEGLDMLVVRILKNGSLSCAKPCDVCVRVMRLAGVRNVHYSTWSGEIACFSVQENRT